MSKTYPEVKQLHLPSIDLEIQEYWEKNNIFQKSIDSRKGKKTFVFYEGPPSANGMPGIHHAVGRILKDLFCRYQTLNGKQVHRKAGWDTHGLPIEISVEKTLQITKEDIGTKISVEDYNAYCKKEVLKYKSLFDEMTEKIGYWVDLENPYVTYHNEYIETCWWLLKQFYTKNLLYKDYTIQPYSPAAGTGLSAHELNQPGCYKTVKDLSCIAQFKLLPNPILNTYLKNHAAFSHNCYVLAWTTTPWTLPSNTALAVAKNINYLWIQTYNAYTHIPITVILAEALVHKHFKPENNNLDLNSYKPGDKAIPYKIIASCKGHDLENLYYEQLLPYIKPTNGNAFKIIIGDFVTTEDGTGVVHIAPSFGADDFRMAKQYNLATLTLVDTQGRFVQGMSELTGKFVKNYGDVPEKEYDKQNVDIEIVIKLKKENKCFASEKYEHSYPHCWRTDKPVIYYPLDAWFIKVSALREKLVNLNKTINWQPAYIGEGRFGNWLAELKDWNLTRSRFWGTPFPVWRTQDKTEELCIGSIAELQSRLHPNYPNPYAEGNHTLDLHKPYIDRVVLQSDKGQPMFREPDLIDVWFDSGAMPYAQWHYPFENKELFEANFPADFIAEGVDQTRGWFNSLHNIAGALFDSVAYKNVVVNGLVLDKEGRKMSKRWGNTVDPIDTINKYGADAVRWYIITTAQAWDGIKFDYEGIVEAQRKFFGTFFNTYSFFSLYANVDGFTYNEPDIPLNERPEIDRWIISMLNSLIQKVDAYYAAYEATNAARLIQDFVCDHLSNWYVRLCRRRFWKGEYEADKIAAYQTLYQCLTTVCQLMSPVAPFISEYIYRNLNNTSLKNTAESVHLTNFPKTNTNAVNTILEEQMQLAQEITSLALALRKKNNLKVRQPLQKILIPLLDEHLKAQVEQVKNLILSEINVKELQYIDDTSGLVKKSLKPDFRKLGKKVGNKMKLVIEQLENITQQDIKTLENTGALIINIDNQAIDILLDEVQIISSDIEGWQVNSTPNITVALDITVSETLKNEGIARELVNRIQNLRKDSNFNLTDRIKLSIKKHPYINNAVTEFKTVIANETLANELLLLDVIENGTDVEIDDLNITLKAEVV